jgi:hypothetical protein
MWVTKSTLYMRIVYRRFIIITIKNMKIMKLLTIKKSYKSIILIHICISYISIPFYPCTKNIDDLIKVCALIKEDNRTDNWDVLHIIII